jgi:hypothetical protein
VPGAVNEHEGFACRARNGSAPRDGIEVWHSRLPAFFRTLDGAPVTEQYSGRAGLAHIGNRSSARTEPTFLVSGSQQHSFATCAKAVSELSRRNRVGRRDICAYLPVLIGGLHDRHRRTRAII